MRHIITLLVIICTNVLLGQEVTGKYSGNYGCSIDLRSDSTYRFSWRFDLMSSWSIGTWSISANELSFHETPVFDTLRRPNMPDSLVLSSDEHEGIITNEDFAISIVSSGGQNRFESPTTLLFRSNKLYYIDKKGKAIKKKPKGIDRKKYNPWYTKVE